jgi:hypothetical protein
MTPIEQGVFRSVSALAILGAPPTFPELVNSYDQGDEPLTPHILEIQAAADWLVRTAVFTQARGRYLPFPLESELVPTLTGEEWMPRKLRKARKIARWLARLSGVRAVFLCNRTAFGLPRDEGDLDFLVIVRHGSIWQTRGLAGLPFVLLGDRPGPNGDERDVVCLSFFLSDQALNLAECALQPDDMYLRHWFLGLLPLVDDGVCEAFWKANATLRQRHPYAAEWIPSPDIEISIPRLRIPTTAFLERAARSLQWKYFPRVLREKANKDTRVMISDERLKFHVDDGREALQTTYARLCGQYGVAP